MQAIILAAGDNERFDGLHKSTLIAPDERTVLENQVEALYADKVMIIAQKKYAPVLRVPISKLSLMNGEPKTVIQVWLDTKTDGPLDTLYRAERMLDFFDQKKEIMIAYCDVIPDQKCADQFPQMCESYPAGVVIFESEDERFQTVAETEFTHRTMKFSGLFWFDSVKRLRKHLVKIPESQRGSMNGIADLVIKEKDAAFFVCNDVIDIGTPEAYKEWVK